MNDLKITIEGKAGTGKTTLGLHLQRLLTEIGFDVSYQDEDYIPEQLFTTHKKEQIQRLRDNSKIVITQKQAPRA